MAAAAPDMVKRQPRAILDHQVGRKDLPRERARGDGGGPREAIVGRADVDIVEQRLGVRLGVSVVSSE